MTTATIDFQQIRLTHNLAEVVASYLGPARNGKWPCPFHKEKTPSFSVKGQRFRCFGTCGISGDVTDFVALMEKLQIKEAAAKLNGYILDLGLSPTEIKARQAGIKAEYEKRQAEQQEQERQRKQEALDRIGGMLDRAERYHSQVEQARPYWYSQGIDDANIDYFKLGYTSECPTFPDSPSYTIPYFRAGKLISIRHRLARPTEDSGKYRPEFAGLPNQLFNLDAIHDTDFSLLEPGEVVLCEGEIKAMYLTRLSIPAVGLPGVSSWRDEWLAYFTELETVYMILDPDAESQAVALTQTFNGNGVNTLLVKMPCKPDDYFVRFGGSIEGFMRILEQGRKIG